jgi:DNA (cytosine-5)-methyltransferase 1
MQTGDGSVSVGIRDDTPLPPEVANELGTPPAAATNWDSELVWVKFHTWLLRQRETRDIMVAPYSGILGICRVIFTNRPYPYLPTDTDYVCRLKYVSVLSGYPGDWRNPSITYSEKSLRMLAFDEADVEACARPDAIRQAWVKRRASLALKTARGNPRPNSYTLGDAFCGGGGVSRGAEQAGLLPTWGFDANKEAMQVFRANFANMKTLCLTESAEDFLKRAAKFGCGVDVLHASPPCQRFVSFSHTGPDQRDDDNMDYIAQLLRSVAPRILTVEEVRDFAGTPLFDRLLCGILSEGYSVRWKIVNCSDFGRPQKQRQRLILIASAYDSYQLFCVQGIH